MSELILASASPRRKDLLTSLGLKFQVCPGDIDETMIEGEDPSSYVLRMAVQKALAVAKIKEDGFVLGADTVVVLDDLILGKPKSKEDARNQLRLLSGREHIVMTGIGMVNVKANRTMSSVEQTIVFFHPLSEEEIDAYIATGEPLDKAGSYGIQGRGAVFVRRIEGDYFNVVGLPLQKIYPMLKDGDFDVF